MNDDRPTKRNGIEDKVSSGDGSRNSREVKQCIMRDIVGIQTF